MECRICKQPISFIKGTRPGQSRKSTHAVHNSELTQILAAMNGEIVTPHPGTQRKLRMELEDSHRANQAATGERPEASTAANANETGTAESQPAQASVPESEIPGAAAVNHPGR